MPEIKLGAGDLRENVLFQKRGTVDDGFGNTVPGGEFETRFGSCWAHLRPLRGTESVMQSRLQGRQPYIITVRNSTDTRSVDESWRVVDARNLTRVFAIAAPPTDPDGKRTWLEFLVTEGEPS